MIDIKLIRENPDKIRDAAKAKNRHVDVVKIVKLDEKYRQLLRTVEEYRAEKNSKGQGVPKEKDAKKKKELLAVLKEIDTKEKELEPEVKRLEEQLNALLYEIPNPAASDVRIGKDDTENEIIKRVGEPTEFAFTPKSYMELAALHDLVDTDRAAKVSGTRFGYLKNEAALLEFALLQFGMETLVKEGFIPVIPPVMVKAKSMRAMGYLEHGGEDETYHFKEDDLYFVGTSEQSVGPMHMDEVFAEKDLPRRYVAFSTCFRREAGTYGKDTKGILRVHQFDKVEMLTLTKPEDSDKEHEYLLALEEKLMQALKLPYHVVKMCTGDLGDPAARKYDIEAWIPSEQKYRETHSTSNCTDFQSRRLNIKFKRQKSVNHKSEIINHKLEYVHMLNGTVFSMNRPIIAILENYQQADGSILIPDVLQKYMGGKKKIG